MKSYFAFLSIVISAASASEDSGAMSSIMRSGMIFKGLLLPLNPLDGLNLKVLSAARAEIGEPSYLLHLTDFQFSVHEQGVAKFTLLADTAIYDLRQTTIEANAGFLATGVGMRFKGSGLSGKPEDQVFKAVGELEIQLDRSVPFAPISERTKPVKFPQFHCDLLELSKFVPPDPMAPLEIVQKFANNISTFMKCWRWVDELDPCLHGLSATSAVLISPTGGLFDFKRTDFQTTGRSLLIGSGALLNSAGGIRSHHETSDGDQWIQMTGEGGIKAWMRASQSEVIWVRSNTYSWVSDQGVMQFEGGPIRVSRNGMVLAATEDWQFVRIFADSRIVLSPGAWNVAGDLTNRLDY